MRLFCSKPAGILQAVTQDAKQCGRGSIDYRVGAGDQANKQADGWQKAL